MFRSEREDRLKSQEDSGGGPEVYKIARGTMGQQAGMPYCKTRPHFASSFRVQIDGGIGSLFEKRILWKDKPVRFQRDLLPGIRPPGDESGQGALP